MAENDMNDSHGIELNKFLIISLLSTLILCIVFAGINYFVMENLLTQKISKINVSQEELIKILSEVAFFNKKIKNN